MLMDLNSL
jgi:glycerol kinase